MKFLNRHPLIKRFWFSLGVSLLAIFMCIIALKINNSPVMPNTTDVGDGDTITITGPENIDISIYSENSIGPTTILNGNLIVISTKPRVKDGYYDIAGVIQPGIYQVSGSSAHLELQENAQIVNPDMVARTENINKKMLNFVFIFTFVIFFVIAGRMINLKKVEDKVTLDEQQPL